MMEMAESKNYIFIKVYMLGDLLKLKLKLKIEGFIIFGFEVQLTLS